MPSILECHTNTGMSEESVFHYQNDTENYKNIYIYNDLSLPLHWEEEIQSSYQCGLVEEAPSLECQYGLLP